MAMLKDSRDCASFITLGNLFQILGVLMKKECLALFWLILVYKDKVYLDRQQTIQIQEQMISTWFSCPLFDTISIQYNVKFTRTENQ